MNTRGISIDLVQKVIKAVQNVVGTEPVSLHEPEFDGNEWLYLKECLDSSYVSSVGQYVNRFESMLADYTGAKYAVSLVNGTSALHLALKLAGVARDEEVLVPALTFVATANAITFCGAVPHFVDCEEATLGISPEKLRDYLKSSTFESKGQCINRTTNRVIRALVPMHTFGHPCEIEGLLEVANEFKLVVVEDAAESLGSLYKGQHTGTFGLLGTLSFNGNKTITTGGGGAILTNDSKIAARARHLSTTAKIPHAWEFVHDEVGYNYRMPNINAALGCAQLERLMYKIEKKRRLYLEYKAQFDSINGVLILGEPKDCQSNYWLQNLVLDNKHAQLKDDILAAGSKHGIAMRPTWRPLSELQPYKDCPAMDLGVTRSLYERLVSLPSSPQLSKGYK